MKFIEGPPSIKGRYSAHINKSLNLGLVRYITKEKFAWYPDNTGVPSIMFHFDDKIGLSWIFETEEKRGMVYEIVLSEGGVR